MTAAAGIRALLGFLYSEAPRPVLTGDAACSMFRSTMSRNGTSCCTKRGFARSLSDIAFVTRRRRRGQMRGRRPGKAGGVFTGIR